MCWRHKVTCLLDPAIGETSVRVSTVTFCCRPVFALFASVVRTIYTRSFAAISAASCLPPQESIGDSRPQAFFVRRSAFVA